MILKLLKQRQSKKENRFSSISPAPIGVVGASNWKKKFLPKKAFQDYAKENLVLVEVDFPKKKEQTAELKAQNKKLDKEYGVEGYPTLYLLDATGKKLTEDIGYREGGPEAYVEHLKSLLKK